MKKAVAIKNQQHEILSRYCAALGNPNRILLLEPLASEAKCIKDDVLEIQGLSKFTVGVNLKYLKKFGLINGTFTSRNLSYCIDYKKLEEFKLLFDDLYKTLTLNRSEINPENKICTNHKVKLK